MPPLHSTIPPTPAPAVPNHELYPWEAATLLITWIEERCSQHSSHEHHPSPLPQVCRVFVDNLIFAGPETLTPGQASGPPRPPSPYRSPYAFPYRTPPPVQRPAPPAPV